MRTGELDMTPERSSAYQANHDGRNSDFPSDGSVASGIVSYASYLFFGYFGIAVMMTLCLAIAKTFIGYILSVVSDIQVSNVDAVWVIATVKYKQPIWYRSVVYRPNNTMYLFVPASNLYLSVPCSVNGPHPYAASCFSDVFCVGFQKLRDTIKSVRPHKDTSTKAIDSLPVSAVVATRRLQCACPGMAILSP